jgi:two-component system, OmpR family, response regulator
MQLHTSYDNSQRSWINAIFAMAHVQPGTQTEPTPPPGVRMKDDSDLAQKPLQALVVEDSPAIAERLVEMLNIPGRVEVIATATTEAEAVAACAGRVFDIAVVDLQLAQGTGFGVIRRLRADAGRHTTIVVLTNHAVPALKIASFEAGADHFLDKSKDFPAVPRVVEELLSERQ